MTKDYPERSECDFTTNYNTPHPGERTLVTPQSELRVKRTQEAVSVILELTKGLSMQERKTIKDKVDFILNNK